VSRARADLHHGGYEARNPVLFTQPIFIGFFALVFLVHWGLRANAQRKLLLLVASYLFYAAWDWRFLFLILVSTVIDFAVGRVLTAPSPRGGRRLWLALSLIGNLGILGFFKYYNFFVTSAHSALSLLGFEVPEVSLQIILPVGISFFTFQSMSYTLDIYRGQLNAIRNFVDFSLYVAFFPQLVAGPIVRAREFLPQLGITRQLAAVPFKAAIGLFLIGFLKKACIADNLAPITDQVFAQPESFDALSIWIAVTFYAVQIYCDFSGYTDMAIAVARLLGYELCVNFDFPYFAANIRDFWRRWHISLSTWLRDYLYISLGGNRGGPLTAFRNIMITMLLGGLWHGASWNFVVWGGLHGLALGVHRLYAASSLAGRMDSAPGRLIHIAFTFYWVCIAWIFFRAPSLDSASSMLESFVGFRSLGTESLEPWLVLWFVPLILCHYLAYQRIGWKTLEGTPDWLCAIGYGVTTALMLFFVPVEYKPFIYFQF